MKLLAILAELHLFDGVPNYEQPLRLGLDIEGRPFLRLCEQWGDSVRVDGHRLEPTDLGEGGEVVVGDVTSRLDPSLTGAELESVRLIESEEGHTMGLALQRVGAPTFFMWIHDDEFRWGPESALNAAWSAEGVQLRLGRVV